MTAKILLVEDDTSTRIALAANLKAEGYQVLTLPDGNRVGEVVAAEDPDLVILDVLMPDITGVEALDKIRASHPEKPVIVCSGAVELEPFMAYSSIDAFLTKPVDIGNLLSQVRKSLGL